MPQYTLLTKTEDGENEGRVVSCRKSNIEAYIAPDLDEIGFAFVTEDSRLFERAETEMAYEVYVGIHVHDARQLRDLQSDYGRCHDAKKAIDRAASALEHRKAKLVASGKLRMNFENDPYLAELRGLATQKA